MVLRGSFESTFINASDLIGVACRLARWKSAAKFAASWVPSASRCNARDPRATFFNIRRISRDNALGHSRQLEQFHIRMPLRAPFWHCQISEQLRRVHSRPAPAAGPVPVSISAYSRPAACIAHIWLYLFREARSRSWRWSSPRFCTAAGGMTMPVGHCLSYSAVPLG